MLDLELDHVGVAIKDLELGRRAFSRLGFLLTAKSQHSGSASPGSRVEPWGSGNHCAMLRAGYIEVVGLTDPGRYSSIKDMVARYEGLHIVAIGCSSAETTHRALLAAGIAADAPRALERDAAFGPRDETTRRARFRNIYLDRERYPEARFLVIEHLTRDVLWQPHLLEHPNGAVALDEVYICAGDAAAAADKLARTFAADAAAIETGHLTMQLRRGTLHVMTPERWHELSGTPASVPLPSPVGFGIRVAALEHTRNLLAAHGVNSRGHGGIWVAPNDACGTALRFFDRG
jgi:hypothetical protein